MATTEEDMSPIIYGALAGVFLLVLTVFVLFSTGSIITVFILWLVIALILIVLIYYGYIDIEKIFETKKETKTTTPEPASKPKGSQIGSEVFHIADKIFTYDEAQAVCTAYDARLATLEQIIEAFNKGAEWCGYGWSAGGMALYPTQKATWDELQYEIDPKKKTRCGRPGVNGGYFDPMNKFGVNCFGFKPAGDLGGKAPLPIDGQDSSYSNAVKRFREMLKTLDLSPFSRSAWSGYKGGIVNKVTNYGEGFTQQYGKLVEKFTEHQTNGTGAYVESLYGQDASYTAAPYGLMGPGGPTGPTGAQGIEGKQGLQGTSGGTGNTGATGPTGSKGDQGLKGNDGAAALAGNDGRDGDTGDTGATGPKGDRGDNGTNGTNGTNGKDGDKGDTGDTGPRGYDGQTSYVTYAVESKTFGGKIQFNHTPGRCAYGTVYRIDHPRITRDTTFTFSINESGDGGYQNDRISTREPYIWDIGPGWVQLAQAACTQYGHYVYNWTGINT